MVFMQGFKKAGIFFKNSLHKPYIGGVLLLIGALLALLFENNPLLNSFYHDFLSTPLPLTVFSIFFDKTLLLWINDGLMAIFFLLVGLEIKREFIEGELSSFKKASLPFVAASGGLIIPIFIYKVMTIGTPDFQQGWAIPAATDIAFAIALLALFGSHLPKSLKVSLLAIAIIDDLAAILIIALFYTQQLSVSYILYALPFLGLLLLLNLLRSSCLLLYLFLGVFLWGCILKSGIHATLAGVILAFFIPLKVRNQPSPLLKLEKALHPWVILGIMPLFSFANSGVSFKFFNVEHLFHPVAFAITLGLFVGKQLGVMIFVKAGTLLKICELPSRVTWLHFYGVALVAGIGFTMSLFISNLAFSSDVLQNYARTGILAGSLLSAVLGAFVLTRKK